MMNDGSWMMNDGRWMMNDGSWMMNDECWMILRHLFSLILEFHTGCPKKNQALGNKQI